MNKKPNYSEMPTEELQILRDKQKKIWTTFANIWIVILLVYLGINIYKGFEKFNFPSSIPIFILPTTLIASLKSNCNDFKLYVLCAHDIVWHILRKINMSDIDYTTLSNEELLKAKKTLKSTKIINAVLIGFTAGIAGVVFWGERLWVCFYLSCIFSLLTL